MSEVTNVSVDTATPEVAPVINTPAQPTDHKSLSDLLKARLKAPAPAPTPAAELEKPAEPAKVDTEVAAGLAQLARLDRAVKAKQAEVERKAKELDEKRAGLSELEPLKAARERYKTSTDPEVRAAALLEILGDNVTLEDIGKLSEKLGQAPASLTLEDAKRLAREEIKAEQEAAAKKAEEDKKKAAEELTRKETAAIERDFAPFLKTNAEKYPAIMFKGVDSSRIASMMREGFAATGKLPTPEDIFDFVEAEYREEAKGKLAAVFPQQAAPPPRTIGAADLRGPAIVASDKDEPEPPKMTLAERSAALKERARKANGQFKPGPA